MGINLFHQTEEPRNAVPEGHIAGLGGHYDHHGNGGSGVIMGMAATSSGNGIGNRGLVEGFIRARYVVAVYGVQYGGVIGIQPFAILGAIRIISAVCASRGLGLVSLTA